MQQRVFVTPTKERKEMLTGGGDGAVQIFRFDTKVMWQVMPSERMYMEHSIMGGQGRGSDPSQWTYEDTAQIGKRSYPTHYVVVYQDQALKRSGYRLSWMTASDNMIKEAQVASLQAEQEEDAQHKENAALRKKAQELEALTKKKDAAEKKQFKKGQDDLEKALGF